MMEEWLLIPTSERTFFSPQDYAEIEVVLDEEGRRQPAGLDDRRSDLPAAEGDSSPAGDSDPRASVIDSFIAPFVELAMFDGNVLVDVGGEIRYERSFGFANYEHGVKNAEDTKFRIASVSKTLTDAAFAVLIQREVLTLETPLAEYLPEFPSAESITISHLLEPHVRDRPHQRSALGRRSDLLLARRVDRAAGLPAARLRARFGSELQQRRLCGRGQGAGDRWRRILCGSHARPRVRAARHERYRAHRRRARADHRHVDRVRARQPGPASTVTRGSTPWRHGPVAAPCTRRRVTCCASRGACFVRVSSRRRWCESVLGADDGTFLAQGRSPGFVAKLLYDPTRDVDRREPGEQLRRSRGLGGHHR